MKKGFTLIELLIVIAILAILATVIVIVLNPTELLRQSRDSTRLSDLNNLNSSIALFLADTATSSWTGDVCRCTTNGTAPPCGSSCTTSTNPSAINGTGWVPINFNLISSGPPLSKLPLDPINNSTYYYVYRSVSTSSTTYKLYGKMESAKYQSQMANDGGATSTWYEVGNDMSLQ